MTYTTDIPGGAHWSLEVRKGTLLTLTDIEGGANVGMLFYNPRNLLERYNAPDTLKCQHTYKLQKGNCLYSDMGRIFASIVDETTYNGEGLWHDTVCGTSRKDDVAAIWGERDYQRDRNAWMQNGFDAFLVELAKYGLGRADLASNINFFSRVTADSNGAISLDTSSQHAGSRVSLRFEMDTLVVLHTCPHPLNTSAYYPRKPITVSLGVAAPVADDDFCKHFRPENTRGFANNALYHLCTDACC